VGKNRTFILITEFYVRVSPRVTFHIMSDPKIKFLARHSDRGPTEKGYFSKVLVEIRGIRIIDRRGPLSSSLDRTAAAVIPRSSLRSRHRYLMRASDDRQPVPFCGTSGTRPLHRHAHNLATASKSRAVKLRWRLPSNLARRSLALPAPNA
jgi:hypothetical protein